MIAPLALLQEALPQLRRSRGTVVSLSSDAAVEGYEGWGGYGSSKAALDQLHRVLAAEEPDAAGVPVRPRGHADGDAPGGVPGRGHLRPARARVGRAGAAGAPRVGGPRRPLPGRRVGRCGHDTGHGRRRSATPTTSPTHWRRRNRRRPGDSPVTPSGCSSPHRDRGDRPQLLRLPAPIPGTRGPGGDQHLGDAARGHRCRRRGRDPARRPSFHRSWTTTGGLSSPAGSRAVRPSGGRGHHPGTSGWPATRRPPWRSPTGTRDACGSPRWIWARARSAGSRPTVVPSATATSTAPGRSTCTRTSTPRRRAAPRCPAPAGRSRPRPSPRLVSKGVGIAPLVLHTGVASLEADELPYPERMTVPEPTAERVNAAHRGGHRVIAVGTTVVRALETAGGAGGQVRPYDGWTDLVISPDTGVRVVDGMITGWHEPASSHLMMLEAVAGRELLRPPTRRRWIRVPVARVR